MKRELIHDSVFLKQKSVKATPADSDVVTDLLDTLAAHRDSCVGMAANMIGVKKNIIVVNMGMINVPMVNPVITKKNKPYETEEGCLSYMGGPTKVTRYEEIEVTYQDSNFKKHTKTFSGFTAQIIQHEVDHLNGILV